MNATTSPLLNGGTVSGAAQPEAEYNTINNTMIRKLLSLIFIWSFP
jgi:hypothetical protein